MKWPIAFTLFLFLTYWFTHRPINENHWSAAEITSAIGQHRNDPNWIPHQLKDGGYLVKTFDGTLVKPPTIKEHNE